MPHQRLQTFLQRAGTHQAWFCSISQHLLDGVEHRVIDAFTESHQKSPGGPHQRDRHHLEMFQQEKGDRRKAVGSNRCRFGPQHGTAPLPSQGGRDLVFGGETQFLQPSSDLSLLRALARAGALAAAGGALRLQRGAKLFGSELLPGQQQQPQWNAMRHHGGTMGDAHPPTYFDERQLQTFCAAIPRSLQAYAPRRMAHSAPHASSICAFAVSTLRSKLPPQIAPSGTPGPQTNPLCTCHAVLSSAPTETRPSPADRNLYKRPPRSSSCRKLGSTHVR